MPRAVSSNWPDLSDEELLDLRLADLPLRLEGTVVETRIDQLKRELEARGLQLPAALLSVGRVVHARRRRRRWRCRSIWRIRGSSGSRRRRCSRSKAASTSGACASCATRPATSSTTPTSCGCAGSAGALFGSSSKPYPEFYAPRPYSKSFVLHLDPWYAQSHPDEDFAETFAVWLTPESNWKHALRGLAGDRRSSNTWTR